MTRFDALIYVLWHPNGPFPAEVQEHYEALCQRREVEFDELGMPIRNETSPTGTGQDRTGDCPATPQYV